MRQYYKHHCKTVLNLINNSLINCAETNSSNFTMILSFIAQNRIHFKTRKKRVFQGIFSQLPETRVFLILPRIGSTIVKSTGSCYFFLLLIRNRVSAVCNIVVRKN